MKLFDCPQWLTDDDSALPEIAQAASAFLRFAVRQNSKLGLLNHGTIKQWHKNLFERTVPVSYYAGHYRGEVQNKPCLNTEVHVLGVFGFKASEVEEAMKRFSEELVRATKATDEYLTPGRTGVERLRAAAQIAAMAGGSIIQIHPFVNGNGRMARLVMNYFLQRYLEKIPFYIDRPSNPNYSLASQIAMQQGNFGPLYQYLVELIALSA